MNYLKYTNGESFTLNSADYSGYFRVIDDVAFSGRVGGSELTPKNTFMSKLYLDRYDLDTTYKNIENLSNVYTNTLDILDKLGIDRILKTLDNNNKICYKTLVLSNPTVFKYEETNGFFYGLSASDEYNDRIYPKRGVINIDTFSNSGYWSFLDNVSLGQHLVDSYENFKYICTDGFVTYTLSGNFNGNIPLTKISEFNNVPYYDKIHNIHYDIDDGTMYFVKNDYIEVYDASNYEICDNLILVDRISLIPTNTTEHIWNTLDINWNDFDQMWNTKFNTVNDNSPKTIKIGKNLRTSINSDSSVLTLYNKYANKIHRQISLVELRIESMIDIAIQSDSDNILLVYKSVDDNIYTCFIEILNANIENVNKLESLSGESYRVEFTEFDSNVFYIWNSEEYQTRNISNPTYPSGRLELNDLKYPKDYIWNTTDELWNYLNFRWDVNGSAANNFNNLTASVDVANNKMYMLLHNVGRLYAMNQSMNDRFYSAIPLNLESFFTDSTCSESSIALYLNSNIANIAKDTLNILSKSNGTFEIYEKSVISKQIEDFILETNNLYLNGNENINITSIQRIMLLILDIQSKILPTSIEN
jgi:hypothetical protein